MMIDYGLPGQIRIVSSISILIWNQFVYQYGIIKYINMESITLLASIMANIGREDETQEFKESTAEMNEAMEAICAMLNNSGKAHVFFGVRDDGTVIGQMIGKNTLKDISKSVRESIEPPVIAKIKVLNTSDGKEYISVETQGTARPYSVKGNILVRTGAENRKAPLSEIRRMILSSGDNLLDTSSYNQELTFKELCTLLRDNGFDVQDDERLRKSFGLLNSDGRLNYQAQLLSDQNDIPLSVAMFRGADRSDMTFRKDYGGRSLLTEVNQVLDFVQAQNEVSVQVGPGSRKERELFDGNAFREAWINACVHNNWIGHIAPTVHIFDDRMEIISYGSIPYWLSLEDFFSGKSLPVNDALMRVFVQTRLTEHTGHGIPVITSAYGKEAFDLTNGTVTVTLRFHGLRSAASRHPEEYPLTEREMSVLDAIRSNPNAKLNDVAYMSGVSRAYVGKIVVKLKDKGLIERIGNQRTGYWKIRQA